MSEKIPVSFNEIAYRKLHNVDTNIMSGACRIDRSAADDYISEAEARALEEGLAIDSEKSRPWIREVALNKFIDDRRKRKREISMTPDPVTRRSPVDFVPTSVFDETPNGTITRAIACQIEKQFLVMFWKEFLDRCNPDEKRIANFVTGDKNGFEHDGTLPGIIRSLFALVFNQSRAMGIEQPRRVLAARVRRRFSFSVSYFNVRMFEMRKHWTAAGDGLFSAVPSVEPTNKKDKSRFAGRVAPPHPICA